MISSFTLIGLLGVMTVGVHARITPNEQQSLAIPEEGPKDVLLESLLRRQYYPRYRDILENLLAETAVENENGAAEASMAYNPSANKRAQTFVRFGKRAQTFVRFG
ncbi:hypothetical protein AB6A40_000756 [Gnathostoma spinigerum]|uniref:Uncharacterized protein n=1 Tax=Gnathostoma spinigerum TaxID=75299 RepID=A0ABD6EC23_9BILA